MRRPRIHVVGFLGGLAAAALAALPASAQTATCALPLPCTSRNPPVPGPGQPPCRPCPSSKNVWHAGFATCEGGGGFDLSATEYRLRCGVEGGPLCPTARVPPVRFWNFDRGWVNGNSGCARMDDPAVPWMVNRGIDEGRAGLEGFWYLYQANWSSPGVDSCLSVTRTALDITFPDTLREGSVDHSAWYLVASVAEGPVGQFNFDNIAGAGNCGATTRGNVVPAARVAGLTIAGKTTPCMGGAPGVPGAPNPNDGGYADIAVSLVDPTPRSHADTGGPELIAGYQVLYATGAEPTTSDYASGAWRAARDPASPATTGAAVIPRGSGGPVTVSVPSGSDVWLATRLIWVDPTENPTGPFLIASPPALSGPQLGSQVSAHCGPVGSGAGPLFAVTKTATPGTVAPGADARFTLLVSNTGSQDLAGCRLSDVIDTGCMTLRSCDSSNPTIPVACSPPTGLVAGPFDVRAGGTQEVVITVTAGAAETTCRNSVEVTCTTGGRRTGFADLVIRAGSCLVGDLAPLERLLGARSGGDINWQWQPDPAVPPAYHLNTLTDRGQLNEQQAKRPPVGVAQGACEAPAPGCPEPGGVARGGPRVYYQVLSACGDDGSTEGPVCPPSRPCPP